MRLNPLRVLKRHEYKAKIGKITVDKRQAKKLFGFENIIFTLKAKRKPWELHERPSTVYPEYTRVK